MTKIYKIIILSLFLLLFASSTSAEETSNLTIGEIGSSYIKGSYNGKEAIKVLRGETLLGYGVAGGNGYLINFSQPIAGGTQLILKIEETNLKTVVTYKPAVLNNVNDKQKIISGRVTPGALVTASVNGNVIPLNGQVGNDGEFEFTQSTLLKYGQSIRVVSVTDDIQSVITTKVTAAPAPMKPKVNTVTNKNTYISGYAEPGNTVIIYSGKTKYTAKASVTSGYYRIFLLDNRPLASGTTVSIYSVADRYNSKSSKLTVKVLDKVPPAVPRVNKITNKSFTMTGSAEANSVLYVSRNSKSFKTVKVNSKGKFYIRVPLQAANTKMEFYAKDSAGNKSGKAKLMVLNQKRPVKKLMSAPLIKQMPQLPRGCEVTSLAMMLNHAGVKTNKMTLAKQVKKDSTKYRYTNGKKYFGNPNYGFVGNMYTFSKPGFGVFNKPIAQLANTYMPGRIVNLSGQSFESVLNYVGAGRPVWVINTSWFSYVPNKYWQTWYTPQGPVRITMKEHSVLITGYDSRYVYFNDPLDGTKNKKRLKKHFIEGWTQYGKQAISYY
ncbi:MULTISPECIES: C39 family peptidase [unclassified Mesobacillus]|uniref:C39 family peptidase n=1 Tax=unclassified Mesobacillus TaxID=2675270 RepID=UPI002041A3E7|nr:MULTISPECIES: C39 family peptidase [unclassified Mesobacillus]MCM3124180.1 C39 family peptidase [Mesobacillus sp. MER 33]MCM3234029.1 C39 family peptidase [Mesobacillus sp. MER 48]